MGEGELASPRMSCLIGSLMQSVSLEMIYTQTIQTRQVEFIYICPYINIIKNIIKVKEAIHFIVGALEGLRDGLLGRGK